MQRIRLLARHTSPQKSRRADVVSPPRRHLRVAAAIAVAAAQLVTAIVVPIVPSRPATLMGVVLAVAMLPRNTAAEAIDKAKAAAAEHGARPAEKVIARVTPAAVVVDETRNGITAVVRVVIVIEIAIMIDEPCTTAVVVEDGIETRVTRPMMMVVATTNAARGIAAVAATRAVAITSIGDAPDLAPNHAAHTTPIRPLPRNIRTASVIEINRYYLFSLLLIVYEIIHPNSD